MIQNLRAAAFSCRFFRRCETHWTVSVKLAWLETPVAVAWIVTLPALPEGVYVTLASAFALVEIGFAENVPPAPPSLKVTAIPEIAFPYLSVTFTTSGCASWVRGGADWPFPDTAAMLEAGPGVTVSRKIKP